MFKKYINILMTLTALILITILIASCGKNTVIEFYKNYDEETGNYSEKIESVQAGITSYAVYQSKKAFGKEGISMSVYTIEERNSVYDLFILIDSNANKAVFDFEIYDPGEYEMVIYFDDDQENPIAKRSFEVITE